MKVIEVQWKSDKEGAEQVPIGNVVSNEAAPAGLDVQRHTKLIVITKDGFILHQCTRPI